MPINDSSCGAAANYTADSKATIQSVLAPHPAYLLAVTSRIPSSIETDSRWLAVKSRDTAYDGMFFYSVKTTGVFCLASCASRTANPRNVAFHPSIVAAQRAGFRACKRCEPTLPPRSLREAAQIAELCRWIDSVDAAPSLDQLAARAGISKFHLQRMFKKIVGVTPKIYALAQRQQRIRAAIHDEPRITDAIYRAGYNSSSQFYSTSNEVLGMTPSNLRRGGAGQTIEVTIVACSLGHVLTATTERGICAILLGDTPDAVGSDLLQRFPHATLQPTERNATSRRREIINHVVALVDNPAQHHALPLDVQGTAFQQRVWQALRAIPLGTTVSYSELANSIGAPSAARAIATACAANPCAVAIPCHRVVRSSGELAGYRWGIERKRALLEREKSPATPPPHKKLKRG